jgi:gliding motility-associated-like protein
LKWKDGVKEYIIEVNNGIGFVEIGRVDSSKNSYVHPNQAFNCIEKLDYRITAIPNKWISNSNRWNEISTSNVSSPVHRAKVFIPNAFTPNQNDLNELFKPEGVFIQSYHLKIFNRWGEKLYDVNGCEHGWDGKFDGALVPEGVYIYQCSIKGVNGERHIYSGDVTLLR